MPVKMVFFTTDILLLFLFAMLVIFGIFAYRSIQLRRAWRQVFCNPLGLLSVIILLCYMVLGLLDSIHFQTAVSVNGTQTHYANNVSSVLDVLLKPQSDVHEKTYSAPLTVESFSKEFSENEQGVVQRHNPLLQHAGKHLQDKRNEYQQDLTSRMHGFIIASVITWIVISLLLVSIASLKQSVTITSKLTTIVKGHTIFPWRTLLLCLLFLSLVFYCVYYFAFDYHLFGTDKVGQDVFYQAIKSIRTGLIIGTLTTLIMLPFALILGTMAGYFGGLVDDVIQYLYTTLSSIPGVLLIAAAILSIQIYIDNHPQSFQTLAGRADARLLALCIILGVTSWTSLCRVLRAETLKLREMDYIQAAKALGSNWHRLLRLHVLPNVMHIVIITVVLDFSTLVLAEAVLTYVGIGVDPTTISWGNMIDSARLELARDPVVWWPLVAAFIFMFTFVLSANLFADTVRDAFDPRS